MSGSTDDVPTGLKPSVISIMYLILPYINDANNYELYKQIVTLEDITCKKKSNDTESNNYVISNYQFSRYFPEDIDENYAEISKRKNIIKKIVKNLNNKDDYLEGREIYFKKIKLIISYFHHNVKLKIKSFFDDFVFE